MNEIKIKKSYWPSNKIKYKDGSEINSILFIKEIESVKYSDGSVIRRGLFECFCGNKFECTISTIFKGKTKSCGCTKNKRISKAMTKHGLHGTPEHRSWSSMKSRCYNKNNTQFNDYGGRGIKVCSMWNNSKNGFINFLNDMGIKPFPNCSLDRIDNDGDYCPENCRWADNFQQANNKRSNILITLENETKTLTEWAREADIHRVTLKYRLQKGLATKRELLAPADIRFKKKTKKVLI